MIDRRAYLFLLLFFVPAIPALAQSSDSAVVSGEQLQTLQVALESVNESMDGLNKRLRQTGAEASSEEGQASLANVLFVFLAIAVVFEAAMSAIFDWRIFI